jgi:REP element-mobilizing transposase RayT
MTTPLAVFFTWTTYGTWLPGDSRGYVSNTLKPDGGYERRHNIPGTPFTRDDPYTMATAKELLKFDPVILSRETACWAADGLIKAAVDKHWRILRGAIMATHVHLLVPLVDDKAWWVRKILKGRTSKHMSDQQGKAWRWWAAGGRDDHLFTDESVANALRYIEEQVGILAYIEDNCVVEPPKPKT